MSELGEDARALLAEARQGQGDDPSAEDRARVRAKVAAALALSTLGGTAASAALPKTAAAQLGSASLATKLVVASLVVATAGVAAVSFRRGTEPRQPQQVAPRTAVSAPSVPPSVQLPSQASAASAAPMLEAPDSASASTRTTKAARALEPSRPPSLHGELALIAAAQRCARVARRSRSSTPPSTRRASRRAR